MNLTSCSRTGSNSTPWISFHAIGYHTNNVSRQSESAGHSLVQPRYTIVARRNSSSQKRFRRHFSLRGNHEFSSEISLYRYLVYV